LRAVVVPICLSLLLAATARADELDDRRAAVAAAERTATQVEAERGELARAYARRTDEVAALKAQPGSFARDRKLGSLLAESRDMAVALDRKDAVVAHAAAELLAARQSLVASIDRELARELAAGHAAEALARERADVVARIGAARRLKIPDESIDDRDDDEDLLYKAAALAQAETELRAEGVRLARRAADYRRQARLVKSRARADEQDVLDDSEPRRPASAQGRIDGPGTPVTGDPTPTPTPGPVSSPPAERVATPLVDPATVLADVVDAGTLDELRRAERTGEPAARAKAADRAAQALADRADRLHKRRAEMERRARILRGEAP
jgi:hypothetical protein